MLGQSKPFGEVEVAPEKFRAAQGIATEISELTIPRRVIWRINAVVTSARAGVDSGHKGIGVQPLNAARLSETGNRVVLIKRYTGHDACELGASALHDSARLRDLHLALRRIRCAEH